MIILVPHVSHRPKSKGYKMLEPDAFKSASPVLRRERNRSSLFNDMQKYPLCNRSLAYD